MALVTKAINHKDYYAELMENTKSEKRDCIAKLRDIDNKLKVAYDDVKSNLDIYKSKHDIDLTKYSEFVNNEYSNGKFFRLAQGLFTNKKNDYELVGELCQLYNLAKLQKEAYNLNNTLNKCDKILNLSLSNYTKLLKSFYYEVHKKLVIEGAGYAFGGDIGWICINRCKLVRPRHKMLDYAKTRQREAELKEKGIKIYNKEEAEYYRKLGIEYKAEDKRVFKTDEYVYQIPLLSCTLPNAKHLKFLIPNYVGNTLKKYTYEELIELADNDVNKICELDLDVKKKLTICNKVDKLLYSKFIRNENQTPNALKPLDRKNR